MAKRGRGKARVRRVPSGSYYAEIYDVKERTIKRWRATAKANGDALPLEDPEALRDWWTRNMKHRPPLGIMIAMISGPPVLPQKPAKDLGPLLPF